MKYLNGFKIHILALVVTLCGPGAAFAGGGDGGGNGLFVKSPASQRLVLWDLYSNAPTLNDSQVGDKLTIQPVQGLGTPQGQWIDYRPLKSFTLLKARLALWATKAPNLFAAVDKGGFISGTGPESYRLLLIATSLYIQSVNQIAVPTLSTSPVTAYPSAFFDEGTGHAFLNVDLFNEAGLMSQAGMLLHERMRSLQMNFYLSNEELQSAVFTILFKNPTQATLQDIDDSHFSLSWIALHSNLNSVGKRLDAAMGNALEAFIHGAIFECVPKPNPPACVQKALAPYAQGSMPPVDPIVMSNADLEIGNAVSSGILGPKNPGPVPLVPKGTLNGPAPALPTAPYFANMYGVYAVTGCRDHSQKPLSQINFCYYQELSISPSPSDTKLTLMNLRKYITGGGIEFAMVGNWNLAQKIPYEKYVTTATLDSVTSSSGQASAEWTLRMLNDGSYVLSLKSSTNTGTSWDYSYDYELTLEKR